MNKTRKFFLDGGANDCHQDYDPKIINDQFEIHAFEPNPIFSSSFKDKNIKYYQYALWIKNEKRKFYLEPNTVGSSLLRVRAKRTGNEEPQEIEVECIDLADFIISKFKKKDVIILRLDIEGAEYSVLDHLIDTGAVDYINEFWIEFHPIKKNPPCIKKIESYFKKGNKLKHGNGLPLASSKRRGPTGEGANSGWGL
tara:strand:- start:685 stop:1275 length:591 start_codon:yes stop_codon:yes gene_type:complete